MHQLFPFVSATLCRLSRYLLLTLIAARSIDGGVEQVGLSRFGSLAHGLHVLGDAVVEGGEIDTSEGVHEDRVSLRFSISSGAVRDLEVRITASRPSAKHE